jgi:hypothetical protein
MDLLKNESGNVSGEYQNIRQGLYFFEVAGTPDGVTVALEITRDGGTTVQEVTTLNSVDIVAVDLPSGKVRATTTGSGASTDVTVRL